MLAFAMATLQLLVAQGFKPVGNVGLELTFHTKATATLRSTHGDYEYYERLLRRSFDRKQPVAAEVVNGELQQVILADRDRVRRLVERGRSRVDVWFTGHDGIHPFDRSDPQAKRIYDTLTKCKRTESWVWFAAQSPDLVIVDVATEDELRPEK